MEKCNDCKHWKQAEVLGLKGKLNVMACTKRKSRNDIAECRFERKEKKNELLG